MKLNVRLPGTRRRITDLISEDGPVVDLSLLETVETEDVEQQTDLIEDVHVTQPGWFATNLPFIAERFPTLAKIGGRNNKPSVPVLPRINMLPERFVEANRKRAIKRVFVMLGSILIGLIIVGWLSQSAAISAATSRLESDQAAVQNAMASVNQLQPVGNYINGLKERLNAAVAATNEQVAYAAIVQGLAEVVPPGVTIEGLDIDYIAPTVTKDRPTCGQPAILGEETTEPRYGCVKFSGFASSTQALNQFMRSIDSVPYLRDAFILPSSGNVDGQVKFNGTAAIGPEARVTDMAMGVVDISGMAEITLVNPDITATPTPEATPTDTTSAAPDGEQ